LTGLIEGKFKLGADAAVAAGPVGSGRRGASVDIQLKGGILSYSRSRGLFAGAKLEGAVISEQWEANETIYGTPFRPSRSSGEEKPNAENPPAASLRYSINIHSRSRG